MDRTEITLKVLPARNIPFRLSLPLRICWKSVIRYSLLPGLTLWSPWRWGYEAVLAPVYTFRAFSCCAVFFEALYWSPYTSLQFFNSLKSLGGYLSFLSPSFLPFSFLSLSLSFKQEGLNSWISEADFVENVKFHEGDTAVEFNSSVITLSYL